MALFRNNSNGGIMDVIRCDDPSYLVWKWHPKGSSAGETARENSIRWGSSLRVKNGEVAVFMSHSNGEIVQDIIPGPYDSILKTENLPIISSAIGLAYNGTAPFQAEIYFINLAQIIQMRIGIPYFDVSDPRYGDLGVQTAVRGVISFKITDYEEFISKYQLRTISFEEFKNMIKPAATKYIKNAVQNAPTEYGIPITQLERRILEINETIEKCLKERLFNEFGVTVSSVDISDIEIDKTSAGYKAVMKQSNKQLNFDYGLNRVTRATSQAVGMVTDAATRVTDTAAVMTGTATGAVSEAFSKLVGTATSAVAQVSEVATDSATAAVDVKEYRYAKHKKTQAGFVKSLLHGGGDLSEAEKKPRFSSNLSKSVSGLVGGRSSKKDPEEETVPPPFPSYHVAVNGQSVGPLDINDLVELYKSGDFTPDSLVWTKGMANWSRAMDVENLTAFFEDNSDEAPPLPPDA